MPTSPAKTRESDATNSDIPPSASRARSPAFGAAPLDVLERYTLLAPLGKGGMAEVFLAVWQVAPRTRRPVVIKRLYEHFSDDPVVSQMFMDEARLVCCLEHECIVKTHEVGVIDGLCCIAMEYLAGQPLRRLIRRTWNSGGLPIDLAVYIAIRVLQALEYAHDVQDHQGRPLEIVHRDISPHNVFVTNNGLVKVLDFGIAKARSHEGRTAAGLIKGKFAYLAPEQANNLAVDRRADVWSVGVVLWEMLSGTRLFKADNEAATLRATLEADIPIASTHRAEVHPELDRILWRALQRDRNLRYRNASDMKQELLSYLQSTHQSPDKSALATMMHEQFHDEIVDQRRLVYELMETGTLAQSEATAAHSTTETSLTGADSAISVEMSRIGTLVQELAARHRLVLHTMLVSLFVFVAVASFFVGIYWFRLNTQGPPSIMYRPGATAIPAAAAASRNAELIDEGEPIEAKAPPVTSGAAIDHDQKANAPIVEAFGQPLQASPVSTSNATTESKAWVPRQMPKGTRPKVKRPVHNYGI